ncbi:Hypothetical predicted protein [Mytilus galloprovincialis]|uniref:C-type lectin domain-containing protein n=1 Tax=Mytilus galloprovincialis TaxID=29158 RepID=A0A8B6DTV9_MYTGA|nr:Hypothetical predicted protein [Mytilus galloprovincialis]
MLNQLNTNVHSYTDDRTEFQRDGGYGSNLDAKTFCNNQNSFVRWYEQSDICPNGSAQHWTSGMRQYYDYTVKYTDEVSKLNPLECFKVTHFNTDGMEYVKCDNVFPFFCQADSTSASQSNDRNNQAGAIGGSISAILIIVIVAVTGIYLYRRRKVKEPKMRQIRSEDHPINVNAHRTDNNPDGQYHEINVKTNNYSLAKPVSNNKDITTIEDDKDVYTRIVSSFEIQNEASKTNNTISNQGYNDMNLNDRSYQDNTRTNPEDDKMHVSDYALAKPITDIEELDPYTTDTDYDHLNNVKKQEMSDVKVYDHLKNATESDPTYDHADNGVELKDNYEDYMAAADECSRQGSFIKWYPDNFCETHDLQLLYWTSETRHIRIFHIRKSYTIENLKLQKCVMLEDDDDEEKEKPCDRNNNKYPYFFHNIMVLAAVIATLVVGISVTTVFVLKRKFQTKKRSESCEKQISNLRHNSTQILMHDNSNYTDIDIIREDSFEQEVVITRYIDSGKITNDDTILSREIFKKDGMPNSDYQIVRKHFNNIENNTNTVSPVASSSSTINTVSTIQPTKKVTDANILTNNSDYDHLNDFKKHSIHEGKVYDHVMTVRDSDRTYDNFRINNTNTKDENYDHVSVK